MKAVINLPSLLIITCFRVSVRGKSFRGSPVTYSAYQKSTLCDIPWLLLSTCFPKRSTQPNNISRLLASGMWRRVPCPIGTKISVELSASICKAGGCRWWKQVYLKYWKTSTELPGVRCQKSAVLMFTAVTAAHLTKRYPSRDSKHVTQAGKIIILYVVEALFTNSRKLSRIHPRLNNLCNFILHVIPSGIYLYCWLID
jgi:hypothetical protein